MDVRNACARRRERAPGRARGAVWSGCRACGAKLKAIVVWWHIALSWRWRAAKEPYAPSGLANVAIRTGP